VAPSSSATSWLNVVLGGATRPTTSTELLPSSGRPMAADYARGPRGATHTGLIT
jgi:hypothetical protein